MKNLAEEMYQMAFARRDYVLLVEMLWSHAKQGRTQTILSYSMFGRFIEMLEQEGFKIINACKGLPIGAGPFVVSWDFSPSKSNPTNS